MHMQTVEYETGKFYGETWQEFSGDNFRRYARMWQNEFVRWGLPDRIKEKICLDAGCGSGAASLVMAELGAHKVYSIDIGDENLELARKNTAAYKDKVSVQKCSVLSLPFENNSFDFSYSFGVLHHTIDPYKGFRELVRVTKPAGKVFVCLYGKGGVLLAMLNALRVFTAKYRIIPYQAARYLTHTLFKITKNGIWPALIDGLYAPIRQTFTQQEINQWGVRNNLTLLGSFDLQYIFYRWPRWLSGNGPIINLFEKNRR